MPQLRPTPIPLLLVLVAGLLLPACALLPLEDWLVSRPLSQSKASFRQASDGSYHLSNGLVSRRFAITGGQWATVSLAGEEPFAEALRGISPEARINVSCPAAARRQMLGYAPNALEGRTDPNVTGSSVGAAGIAIGGLRGQQRYALLEGGRWNLTKGAADFVYTSHDTASPSADWAWVHVAIGETFILLTLSLQPY